MASVELEDMNQMDGKESAAAMLPQKGQMSISEGAKLPQYMNAIAATSIVFVAGAVIGWTSPALPYLLETKSSLHITTAEASWIGSLMSIGALIGALPAGAVADLIGRKVLILALAIPFVISTGMIHFTKTVGILYPARLISGMAIGSAYSIVPIYLTEIAEDSARGTLIMTFPCMMSSGLLAASIIAASFSYETLTLFCFGSSIVGLLMSFFLVETPHYYLKKGKKDKAEECLMKIRGPNFNASKEMDYLENHLLKSNAPKISLKEALKTRESKYALILSFGVMLFHQSSGVSILSYFGGTIIRDTNLIEPETGILILSVIGVISTFLGSIFIEKAGRKTLLQLTIVACGLCLAYLGYFFHVKTSQEPSNLLKILSLTSMCVYSIVYHLGIGPVPWLIVNEVLPPDVKAVASGWITCFNWSLSFSTAKCFHPLLDSIGPAATFCVFAFICFLGGLLSFFFLIETRGKTLVEIQRELGWKNNKQKSSK